MFEFEYRVIFVIKDVGPHTIQFRAAGIHDALCFASDYASRSILNFPVENIDIKVIEKLTK